jgi:hypothetical protein
VHEEVIQQDKAHDHDNQRDDEVAGVLPARHTTALRALARVTRDHRTASGACAHPWWQRWLSHGRTLPASSCTTEDRVAEPCTNPAGQ